MNFDLRQLQYFVVLAEELHFGRAARRLCISQPPLSVAIKQMEAALQAPLFVRSSKEVRLTAAGTHLLGPARDILERSRRAALDTQAIAQGLAGTLRLGIVGSSLYRGLPQALERFRHSHPGVRVDLQELNSAEQVAHLLHGRLDLGLLHTLAPPAGLVAETLLTEPFWACLPAGHALAGRADLAVAELAQERLVLFAASVSPEYFRRIEGMCMAAGFSPDLRHEVRHWMSVLSLVATGQGVSLVPECLRRVGLPGLVFRPLRGEQAVSELQAMYLPLPDRPLVDGLLVHLRACMRRGAGAD